MVGGWLWEKRKFTIPPDACGLGHFLLSESCVVGGWLWEKRKCIIPPEAYTEEGECLMCGRCFLGGGQRRMTPPRASSGANLCGEFSPMVDFEI